MKTRYRTISYPELSDSLASSWLPGETLGNSCAIILCNLKQFTYMYITLTAMPLILLISFVAFQAVPSFQVTAKKLMHNFLHIHPGDLLRHKRATIFEDVVILMDGSESIPICKFNNVKEALRHIMVLAKYNPSYDTKYAAVSFGSSATVNFKFLPYPVATRMIMRIPYPNGATNTQAGLEEARKLFADPSSGKVLCIQCIKVNPYHA